MPNICSFCDLQEDRVWFENSTGVVLWDGFPVSQGHTLVVPKQHVASLFDLPLETQMEIWKLVTETRFRLQEKYTPDGFNIGVNDGEAAGQTVMHAHVHIIPRWDCDVPDARGGIRWVLPDFAKYWGDE